jgi:sugar phosphate isomerase/epimerase
VEQAGMRTATASAGIRYAGIGDEAGASLTSQIAALKRLGWRSIELRAVDGVAIADLDDRAFGRVTDGLAAAGLDVVCVDSRIANWSRPITGAFERDTEELSVLARRCELLGTRYIRIMSYPNDGLGEAEWGRRVLRRLRLLAHEACDRGLVLLHENCSGWAATSAARMLDLLDRAGPGLRLLYDIGNGVAYGYDASAMLAQVAGHVAHVHVKDALGTQGHTVYTMPGEGSARVAECLRILLRHGYAGALSIEPHMVVRPHEHGIGSGGDGDVFVAYGRRLERLVRAEVLAPRGLMAGVAAQSEGAAR